MYIEQLTNEDIEAINEFCFENPRPIEKIYKIPANSSCGEGILYLIKGFGSITLYDYTISCTSQEYFSPNKAKDAYALFMLKRFGNQYLEEYINFHWSLDQYKQNLKQAQELLNRMEKVAQADKERLQQAYEQSFFESKNFSQMTR